jgi:general secretion pathway protein B
MSFILDALKKSESERQRRNTPGIADVPQASRSSPVPRWIWILGSLLAVNTVVLIGLVLRPEDPGVAVNTAVPREAALPQGNSDAQASVSFSDLVAEAKRSQVAPAETTISPQESMQPAATVSKQTVPPATNAHPSVSDGLPSFNSLLATRVLQLPELHLDIHVYAQQPASRFVFVNMNKYKEGATLTEGPLVKEITPEGVVLEQSGTIFLLPRE